MGTIGTRPVRVQYGRDCPMGGNVAGSASCLKCAHLRSADPRGRAVLCSGNRPAFTEATVQEVLDRAFLSNPRYLLHNLSVFGWESDYLAMTQAGLWHEVEVKVSVADFRRDFRSKVDKHAVLSGLESSAVRILKPNTFTYAVPETIAQELLPEVPEYAGLVAVPRYGSFLRTLRKAPTLTREKFSEAELGLAEKFYWNYRSYRDRYAGFAMEKENLKSEIAFLKAEFEAVTGQSWKRHLDDIL